MNFPNDEVEKIVPTPFRRPDSNIIFRITNRIIPPPPPEHEVLSYGDLKKYFRGWHYLLGIPLLVVFIVLTATEDAIFHGFDTSPLSIFFSIMIKLWHILGWKAFTLLLPVFLGERALTKHRRKHPRIYGPARQSIRVSNVGILNSMAVLEEQWFREGSENWTIFQRFRSCVGFGFAHMANLFYPFSTLLPLSLGGYLFMRVYLYEYKKTNSRRDAILAASLVHRVYNRVALYSVFISVAYLSLEGPLHWPKLNF